MPDVRTPPVRFFAARSPDTAGLSHAVRVSFADGGAAGHAAGRLTAAIESCWPDPHPAPALWQEHVAAAAGAPLAARRRAVELTRPIGPGQPPARWVLLGYADGAADLIVVCLRTFLAEEELYQLARLLLAGPDSAVRELLAVAAARPGGSAAHSTVPGAALTAAPVWGFGDRQAGSAVGTSRTRLDPGAADGDLATWLTALCVVLSRYEDAGPPDLTGHDLAGPMPVGIESGAGPAAAEVHLSRADDVTLGELAGLIRSELDSPAAQHEPTRQPGPAVGLRIIAAGATDCHIEYSSGATPVFALTLHITGGPGPAGIVCHYRLGSFAPEVARQFALHVAQMHRQVLVTPDCPAATAELLDAGERARIAALGRPARPLHTNPACVHHLVRDRAMARPDAPAVSDGKQRISYAELDERSDQVAHGLRALGIGDGDRVGICLERSAELVITLLGVLKAGAVYVPMDPAYPGRLSYTARDAGLRVVIGTPGEFPACPGVRVIAVADVADLSEATRPGPPVTAITGQDAAYVIYTSGSTGRPKGVVVPHANVVALIDATRAEFRLGETDVWSLFHSGAFDFSVWEIWGCLLTGGHLVVVPLWVARSPDEYLLLLAQEQVTVLSQTPSAFGQLLRAEQAEPKELAVRLVIFGGEPLDARMLLPWFDRHPESACRVVNMFGITETTVHVTAETITRQHALDRSRSVGQALPGWHLYVMDAAQRMAPPGVAGEICVGGAGVAAGYLNRPELTSQRFVRDPVTGLVMYRSGDKGRLRPDGKLKHLGRLDSQVKLRGFRIELEEIRSVLLESPGVLAAAVVVSQPDAADPASARLDAYVVLGNDGGSGAVAGVRERAAAMLPDYMVPASVIRLDALPLTTNGKLDTARLPAPEASDRHDAADPGPAAGGDLIADMLAAWAHALGRHVAADDDFFTMGGNSLCAVRVSAAMRDRGWPRIPIREIYRNPTVRRLAAWMSEPTCPPGFLLGHTNHGS